MSSLANYILPNGMLAFNSIDANDFELDGVPISGSGGGGGDPSTWSQYTAIQAIQCSGNAINNCGGIGLNDLIQISNNTNASGNSQKQLVISDGVSNGIVYDTVFNPLPAGSAQTLRQVLLNGANANGLGISNVGSMTVSDINGCNAISVDAITGLSTINGNPVNMLQSPFSMISYYNVGTQQTIPQNTAVQVLWQTNYNPYNTIGTSPISNSGAIFTNTSSSNVAVGVSGFISWSAPAFTNTFISVWGVKNAGSSDKFGYSNTYCPNLSQYPVIPFNFNAVLAPNDNIIIYVGHNDSAPMNINTIDVSASKICIVTY
ncbi:MAG: hypothetical protein P4L79_07735 [Legionella sp.]|uniref:hypothetical protein n=1 Tax=Legionella sp. TaxID=459 RepID=UPI00284204F9|nr:hypothetical protein [Legionella sp.]